MERCIACGEQDAVIRVKVTDMDDVLIDAGAFCGDCVRDATSVWLSVLKRAE